MEPFHVMEPVIIENKHKTLFSMTNLRSEEQPINWIHTSLLTITPLLALVGFVFVEFNFKTFIVFVVTYNIAGLGITAGYHRYWSHRSFKATRIVQIILALMGAAAFEGSIRWWSRNHRAHHKYVDTDKDPYNVIKGFMHAHIGWMIYKQDVKKCGRADISDLDKDTIVIWQHKNYALLALIFSVCIPTLICGLWNDFMGGFFYASMLRIVFLHHSTFFVNSLAHYVGNRPFSDNHTAANSMITAMLTFGEGYHNYHHEFPQDYRNGIQYYHYDPTKWLIAGCSLFGLTYDLHTQENNEIMKARVQMSQRNLDAEKLKIEFEGKEDKFPVMTAEEVTMQVQQGKNLIVLDGFVLNIEQFLDEHPGGRLILLNEIGKSNEDTTRNFNVKHKHTYKAQAQMKTMRIARLIK